MEELLQELAEAELGKQVMDTVGAARRKRSTLTHIVLPGGNQQQHRKYSMCSLSRTFYNRRRVCVRAAEMSHTLKVSTWSSEQVRARQTSAAGRPIRQKAEC